LASAVLDIVPGESVVGLPPTRSTRRSNDPERSRLEILRRFNDLMAADMTVRVDVGDDDMEAARRWYLERARLEVIAEAEARDAAIAEAAD